MQTICKLWALFVAILSGAEGPHGARRQSPRPRPRRWLNVEWLEDRAVPTTSCDFDGMCSPSVLHQYQNDPGPAVMSDGPTGNYLRLATKPTTTFPDHNTLTFDLSDAGAFDQVLANFDFRITPTPGFFPADGFGFTLLNTAIFDTTGPIGGDAEEPNFAGSLGIGFDKFKNAGEISANHVSVHFNGAKLAEFDVTPVVNLASGDFIHARIILRPGGGYSDVSVILTPPGEQPTTVVDRFVVPGFTPYEGRVHFGARVGGGSADHDLDNIDVAFSNLPPHPAGVLDFSAASYTADERNPEAVITVTRTGGSQGVVTAHYSTADVTATAGQDYNATSGTVTFLAGDTSAKTIRVPIRDDFEVENPERFNVLLSNPTGGALLGIASQAAVTIFDNEGTVQDFNTPNTGTPYVPLQVPPPTTGPQVMDGGPSGTGKFLRLVSAPVQPVPGTSNTITFPRTDAGAFGLVVADFDFRITPVLDRADGLAFALLNAAFYKDAAVKPEIAPFVAEEPNFTGSLGLGLDVYRSPDLGDLGNDNIRPRFSNSISVHFDGNLLANGQFDVTPVVDMAGGRWIHARIIVRSSDATPNVSVLLTPNGEQPVAVVDHLPVPGLMPYETRTYFAARSGGEIATSSFDLDNINVRSLNPSQSVLSFSTTTNTGLEGGPAVLYTVTRTGGSPGAVTVDYGTQSLTATAGLDFLAPAGTLTFGPGETSKTFSVSLLDDTATEGDESFQMTLANPTGGAVVGGPVTATTTIADDEASQTFGHWGPVTSWPIVAIHAALLPLGSGGQLVFWDRLGNFLIWDPVTQQLHVPPLPGYDAFCAGAAVLPDGRLLVTGGHDDVDGNPEHDGVGLANASIYDPYADTWTAVRDMNAGRWYPTDTLLPSGDVLFLSGSIDHTYKQNTLPEILQLASNTYQDLTNAEQQQLSLPLPKPQGANLYPWMFVAPDGRRVFKAGTDTSTWFLDTADTGNWTRGPDTIFDRSRTYGSAVMYQPGKILIVGGGDPPTATAEMIDLNDPQATWHSAASMAFARRQHNATVLPDGKVLVTGGSSSPGFGAGNNGDAAPVLPAELWDPDTNTWTTVAAMQIPRLYHSVAMLLPDGTVVSAGGGEGAGAASLQNNMEPYSPPYLFQGPRPVISSAPPRMTYGQTFFVETPDAANIGRVSLISMPFVTHSFNQNQHYVPLQFTRTANGLMVTAPASANDAPPGGYMLFLVNSNGVPAVAPIVQLAAQALQFDAASYTVNENGGSTQIVVTRTGTPVGAISVAYATSNGSATAGADYTAASGTLTWADGDTTPQVITIAITDDLLDEADETVNLTLSNPSLGVALGFQPATALLTIRDNDPPPALSVSDVTVTEGNNGTVNAIFTVSLSAVSGQDVTFDYATANGTATAGQDYAAASGMLTIPAGQPGTTTTVVVNGDTLVEGNERFFVNLSNPINATISDGQGVGTIISDCDLDNSGPTIHQPVRVLHARKTGKVTALVLTFSEPLDPGRAQTLTNYLLQVPRKGRKGKLRPLALVSALYDSTKLTVTLIPARPIAKGQRAVLTVRGTAPDGVADRCGNLLDGNGDGLPGGTFTIKWKLK
jgi:hypothetical protein